MEGNKKRYGVEGIWVDSLLIFVFDSFFFFLNQERERIRIRIRAEVIDRANC